ncbi:hypothetical protein [Latilactobacillus curvatus]|nr:hypothetical protein [Latilactobacillus curvatus]
MTFEQAKAAADKWYREELEIILKHIQMHRIIKQRKEQQINE